MPMIPCFGCGCQDIAPILQYAQRFDLVRFRLSCAKCGRHTQWFKPEEEHDMEVAWNDEDLASPRYDEIDVLNRLTDVMCACGGLRRAIDTLMERKDEPLTVEMQARLRDAKSLAEDTSEALSHIKHKVDDWLYPQDEEDEYPEVDCDDY